MIENQQYKKTEPSLTINEYQEKESAKIVRKYINSAIYVEKTVNDMTPNRKTSPLSSSDEDISGRNTVRPKIYQTNHKIHSNNEKSNSSSSSDSSKSPNSETTELLIQKTSESVYSTTDQSTSCLEGSESTVKPNLRPGELRISLTCLTSDRTDRFSLLNSKEKEEIVQSWMQKKEQEKRQKEIREAKLAKQKEEERLKLIEKERENFKRWLEVKRKEESKKKMEKELEEEEEKLKEAEKQKKKEANEISFNLWLRRKKKTDLERKIREKLALLHLYEEKQKRMEENEKAYHEWLRTTQHRQKPVPMNRGLESLCSSTSVTYINPVPWTPNIDIQANKQYSI